MIPGFNHPYVLPPFVGDSPTAASDASPYRASILEMTQRFASLPGRRRLIEGLLNYRADLAALGFVRGFQWLDCSSAEDIEAHEQRPPNDMDIVTFAFSPVGMTTGQIKQTLADHPALFMNAQAKKKYGCDAYMVPMDRSPVNLVNSTTYYFGLFLHRRSDQVWKGLSQIPLESDDALAREWLKDMPLGEINAAAA